jgi:hypothetical protein
VRFIGEVYRMKAVKEEFYSKKRWQNWLNKVKESKFTLSEPDEKKAGSSGAVFVYIMDDVVLACLKVIARCEREVIHREEAISEIDKIREIVFEANESLGEDADLMLESLRTSLAAVFVSCQRYIAGDYSKDESLGNMIKKALEAESQDKMEEAFDILSQIGARVIGGDTLPEASMADLPYGIVAELLDGIEAISAAMIGDTSYKEDDGTVDAEEEI